LFKRTIFVIFFSMSMLLHGCRGCSKESEQKTLTEEINKVATEVSNATDNSEAQMQCAKTNYMETQNTIANALADNNFKNDPALINDIHASAKIAEESAYSAQSSAEIAMSKYKAAEKAYSSLIEDVEVPSEHSQSTKEIKDVVGKANKDALRADGFQIKAKEYAHLAGKSEQDYENAIAAVSEIVKTEKIVKDVGNLVENAKQNIIQAQNSLMKLETTYKIGNMDEANQAYREILELSRNTEKIMTDGEQNVKLINDYLGNIDKKLSSINAQHTEDNKSALADAMDKMSDKTQKTAYLAESLAIELDQQYELMNEIMGKTKGFSDGDFQKNKKNTLESSDRKDGSNTSNVYPIEIPSMPLPPKIVSLPKGFLDVENIVEDETINEHVATIKGSWLQVSGGNKADFLPGGYLTNVLTFKSRDILQIRRTFGKEEVIKIVWRLKYRQNKENTEFVIESDGKQELLKRSHRGIKELGVDVEAARQSIPATFQYELLKDGRIIINDKIYQPIK
jgi:hypothetical protein